MEFEYVLILAATLTLVLLVSNVGRAQADPAIHPVFRLAADVERIDRLKETVQPVMDLSEDELIALVPDRTGFYYLKCANCSEGTHESQLKWSIELPNQMTCQFCGTVFPNPRIQENQKLKVLNPIGVEVEYPYWEDGTGYRFFFSARAWYCARIYLAGRTKDLSELFQMTGEREYSRRAALILEAFARHYPGYLVCYDEVHLPKAFHAGPPYPRRGGKWGGWRYDEIPTELVFAYDAISDSGDLEQVSEEKGLDLRHMIEEDFFMGGVRQDAYHGPLFTNASPATYEGYAVLGRVLGKGELVHVAVRRIRKFISQWFFVDGFWREGTMGYHRYTLANLQRALDVLEGYSDPVDFVDPVDGTRIDALSIETEFPVVNRARDILDFCRYPDGRPITVHDSWSKYDDGPIPQHSQSVLLTGAGHAWLGFGNGAQQCQAHLHFSDNQFGHTHADMLNLILYANGEELVPDVGYSHSRYRGWTTGTLCHNTVLIDETEQFKGTHEQPGDGQLVAFESSYQELQWVEAQGERSYPDLAQHYRRGLLLVKLEDGNGYVVDLFSVRGGEQHDWVLHGSADRDSDITANIPMEAYGEHMLPGVPFRAPLHARDAGDAQGRNPNYGFVRNVNRGKLAADTILDLRLSGSPVGLRTHLPGMESSDLYLGVAPSMRRAEENDDRLDEFTLPVALIRREGVNPLSSEFVAIHEPFNGLPHITQVTCEGFHKSEPGVAVRIEHSFGIDWILRNYGSGSKLEIGEMSLEGNLGFLRVRDGRLVAMGLLDGKALSWKDSRLAGPGTYSGVITNVLREAAGEPCNALVVEGDLPVGDALGESTVIVRFGDGSTLGYAVRGVETDGESKRIILGEDPGIEVHELGAKHLFCPGYDIPGKMTFGIRATAFVELIGTEPDLRAVGSVSFTQL
jgi:hypothetical protein